MSKSMEKRLAEVKTLYKHLFDLGLSDEVCPAIKEFKMICNDFVKNGIGSSGKIRLHEINRDLVYILSMQTHITSNVTLKIM
jgi:hypothetical protein